MQNVSNAVGHSLAQAGGGGRPTSDIVEGPQRPQRRIVIYGHSEALFRLAIDLRSHGFVVSVFRDTDSEPVNIPEVLSAIDAACLAIVELGPNIATREFRLVSDRCRQADGRIGIIGAIGDVRKHGSQAHFAVIPHQDDEILRDDGTAEKIRLFPCSTLATGSESVAQRINQYLIPLLV